MRKPTEAQIQSALVQWFHYAYPTYAPLFWHTPNGGSRHVLEAVKLKAQGVKAGVPDLFLAVPRGTYHGMFLELKASGKKPTSLQFQYLELLKSHGYYTEWSSDVDQARCYIEDYLAGRVA